jgi:hypothetical protein
MKRVVLSLLIVGSSSLLNAGDSGELLAKACASAKAALNYKVVTVAGRDVTPARLLGVAAAAAVAVVGYKKQDHIKGFVADCSARATKPFKK